MDFYILSRLIKDGKYTSSLYAYLPEEVRKTLDAMTESEITSKLRQISEVPIRLNDASDRSLHHFRYSAAWLNIFERMSLPADTAMLEIAAGSAVHIAQALDAYAGSQGRYVAFNMNKELTRSFYQKTASLRMNIRIVEDNALKAPQYFDGETFDVIAFHHAVNDIIQTSVADADGIDTIHCDWQQAEPRMLRAVMRHHDAGTLKAVAYPDFTRIVECCRNVLKMGGIMVFSNFTFTMDYEALGYSMEFHNAYIALARQWIGEANLGLSEVLLDGYDPKWWMILRKE